MYVVGDVDGKVPVVHYESGDKDNLPGGHVEPGESIDETISREMHEELNCEMLSWEPLGYQEVIEQDGSSTYQLRAYATLKPLGRFENDPGGSVVGHLLVPLEQLNEHIKYGDVGERMMKLALGAREALATTPK